MAVKPPTHNDYTVGWVCTLPKEQTAATAMLDQKHDDLPKPPNDPNAYTLGTVGKHNIVIACLPKGKVGTNPAATVAAWMISSFPSIKFGLMVGIGGGIPPKVRLGDVVVSTPVGQFPGVVQWDFGKATQGGNFERTGSLNNPPSALLTALTKLETEYELNGSQIPEYLIELEQKWPKLAAKCLRLKSLEDVLFKAGYGHVSESTTDYVAIPDYEDGEEEGENCRFCDRTQVVKRKPRDMRVHYGLVASGNQVIKDSISRDKLNKDLGGNVLCVEMEAAGLMNNFPCIIIRGICDYADSHKNKNWQEHAAAVAAGFAKELLGYVQPSDVDGERAVKDILGQVFDTVCIIGANVAQVQSKLDGDKDLEILNWLTPINFSPQQSDYIMRRQSGTGQWLLDSAEFQVWLKSDKQTLFCPGIPGAGKTILSSIVVDHLDVRFGNDASVGIAYIYCSYQEQQEQKPEGLLSSLLKQLAQNKPVMLTNVKHLFKRHKTKQTRPSFDEIIQTLHSTIQLYSRAFIVIDALDEYHGSNRDGQNRLLSAVFNLQNQTQLNLFATSRYVEEITSQFKRCMLKEIRAQDDDVLRYVNVQIPQLLRSQISKHPEVQDTIRKDIVKAADGMFLLARLHMDSLMSQPTLGDIKQALRNLPQGSKGLDETYKQAVERITYQPEGYRKLADQILSWVTHAKRALSIAEIQHALAVRAGMTELNEDFLPEIETIGSICAGLITVDKNSDIVRLVHYTTQEYFKRTSSFKDADRDITVTCVTYLSFDTFATGFCLTEEKFKERLGLNPLYDYAARNWGHHACAPTIEEERLIIGLLKSASKVSAASQVMVSRSHSSYYQRAPTQMTGVHVAAYFGLEGTVIGLLKNGYNPDLRDAYGQTPLLWAAGKGHEAVVKLLLETGKVDVDSKDKYGRTALSLAAGGGHEAVVKLLLEMGKVDVNSKEDDYGQTALSWAAGKGHKAVVKLLLETGKVDVDSKEDKYGRTALSRAAGSGHEAVVKLLLETGKVDVNSKNKYGRAALSLAAENGHEAVAKLLIKTGKVDVGSKDEYGQTALSWAAGGGHEAVVKLLLEMGEVDIDLKGGKYG